MRKAWWILIFIAASLFAALPIACGGGGSSGGGNDTGGAGTGAGGATGGSGGEIIGGSGPGSTLEIKPPAAEIIVTNGTSTPIDFECLSGGTSVNAKWSVDKSSVATADKDGITAAVGDKGGEVKVTCQYGNDSKTAILTVKIVLDQNPGMIPDTEIGVLKGPGDPDPTAVWLYPYDKTVFPKGIYPPELMWNGTTAGDSYLVHYKTKYVDVSVFTKAEPPSRFLLDEKTWRTVTESGKGEDVQLQVKRVVAGAAKASLIVDHSWKIATSALRGVVYYWSNSAGRILRIDPGKGTPPEDFLAAAGINQNCSTCHTVSADGLTLVMGGDVPNTVYNLLTNTTTLSLPNLNKSVREWAMPAVSPDGKVLVENNATNIPGPPGSPQGDGMWNPQTGEKLVGTGLDGIFLGMPAFAPSGRMIAAVDRQSLGLIKYAFDPMTNMVSGLTTLVEAGGDPTLNAICFPSVAPTEKSNEFSDATWVTYHRGTYPASLDTRNGFGDLFLASMDTPGIEIRLRNAGGDDYAFAAGERDRHYNYEPTFAPQAAGGYHWIVFTSRRTYGNRLTGGKNEVKQLWIAAVDPSPQGGIDPSHPAFWIPGQDANLNMRGFWAQDNCIQAGLTCTLDSDCCSGTCTNGVCEGLPPDECLDEGGSCTADTDCCDFPSGAVCEAGQCVNDMPN